jgi:hypothetical protein
MNAQTQQRFPDTLETSDGTLVRLSLLKPEKTIYIGKRRIPIKVKDIPQTSALLTCGVIVRGIAFTQGNVVFCEKHQEDEIVEEIVS